MRGWLQFTLVAAACAGPVIAHHSYGDYDRNAPVSLTGTVKNVLWANPHVVLSVDIEGRGVYRVEWWSLAQLARQEANGSPVKVGDRVTITGSVNRNPELPILTLVREIRRPSDGWRWADPRFTGGK